MKKSRFTRADISEIRDRAIKNFTGYPYRTRLLGTTVDLDDSEKRSMAFFEATLTVLNRMGLLDPDKLAEAAPALWTEVQEVNDEQTYGQTFTPQKK